MTATDYTLFIIPSAEKDCDKLSKEVYQRFKKAILKLEKGPRPHGCQKLVGEDGYRIRFGDYRILYRVDDQRKQVYIYRVKHRKEAYR